MSGAARTDAEPRAGSAGAVIGAALCLLAVAGVLALLARRALAAPGEDDAALCERLLPAPRPFALTLEGGGTLPSGARWLRLATPADAAADAPGPAELLLLECASPGAAAGLFDPAKQGMDAALAVEEWKGEPQKTLRVELERGELAWGPYVVPFTRERAYLESGAWRELQRVDLSTAGRGLVAALAWPEAVEADEAALRALLDAIRAPEPAPR